MKLFFISEIFTNYTIPGDTQHIEKDEPIMFCDCPPACNFSKYESNVVAIPIDEEEDIMLDVHFDGPTSIRYRMHVVVTGLSLLGNSNILNFLNNNFIKSNLLFY